MLELVSTERYDYLLWLLDTLRSSPARFAVLRLQSDWQAETPKAFAAVIVKAGRDLDRLEHRRNWRHPRQIVEAPHLPALWAFAHARRQRVSGIARVRRLEIVARRLGAVLDRERTRRELETFLREPGAAVDLDWLRASPAPLERQS